MLFIGPEAEQRFGRRNFMDLVSVFTANPEFTVIQGRHELGTVDPIVLTRKVAGPRIIVLAARSWEVTYIDWKRRRCYVEPSDISAKMRWMGDTAPLSFSLCRAVRDVLLGADPDLTISKRATEALVKIRAEQSSDVSDRGLVLLREDDAVHWWTWAGARANSTLIAGLPDIADDTQRPNNFRIRLSRREGSGEVVGSNRRSHLERRAALRVNPRPSLASNSRRCCSQTWQPQRSRSASPTTMARKQSSRSRAYGTSQLKLPSSIRERDIKYVASGRIRPCPADNQGLLVRPCLVYGSREQRTRRADARRTPGDGRNTRSVRRHRHLAGLSACRAAYPNNLTTLVFGMAATGSGNGFSASTSGA